MKKLLFILTVLMAVSCTPDYTVKHKVELISHIDRLETVEYRFEDPVIYNGEEIRSLKVLGKDKVEIYITNTTAIEAYKGYWSDKQYAKFSTKYLEFFKNYGKN